jgi:DNA-binding SARP family transcriptional activator
VAIHLLGDIEVRVDGRAVDLGHARQRCVLAALVLDANRVVPATQLLDRVWGDRLPHRSRNALSGYVSRLRRIFADTDDVAILRQPGGYLLRLDPMTVDLCRFDRLTSQARTADEDDALALLEQALALWRGPAFATLDTAWLDNVRVSVEARRLAAELDLNDLVLARGGHASLVSQLSELADAHPLDERLAGQRMLALYRCGRQSEALRQYEGVRLAIADELGVDPGPPLRSLYHRILAADPALDAGPGRPASGPDGSPARHQLPPDVLAFTGRDGELDAITAEVVDGAAATGVVAIHALDGMPGVGKTALAVHAAHRLAPRFPDGQLLVDLHGHTPGQPSADPAAVLATLLSAHGVDTRYLPATLEERAGLWRRRLSDQRLILVLDNAASSEQVTPLLPGVGCLVLITSRRHLGDLPGSVRRLALTVLPPASARAMFQRLVARAVDDPVERVDELAAVAGYLPLAISLLARVYAKHPTWTVQDLLAETRTRMLTIAAEHATTAAAFDLSYRHLPAGRQRLFRHLGLHPGPEVDCYAAAALAGLPVAEAAEHLDALYGDNLLVEVTYRRYAMHDLIRQYARTLAATDPDIDRGAAVHRLLDCYQHTALVAEKRLARQTRPAATTAVDVTVAETPDLSTMAKALTWIRHERANLMACLADARDPRVVVALTAGLAELLRRDGPWTEAIALHTAAAEAAHQIDDRLGYANALTDLADVARRTGDYPAAGQALKTALGVYHELDDRLGQANALTHLANVQYVAGGDPEPEQAAREALALYRRLGDRLGEANALTNLGVYRRLVADFAGSGQLLRQALAAYRDLGDRLGQATALTNLGIARYVTGDYPEARDALEQALAAYRDLGDRLGQANALTTLGNVGRLTGDHAGALRALEEGLAGFRELGDRLGQANALTGLGAAKRLAGDYPGARRALQEAVAECRDVGNKLGEAEALNEAGALYRVTGDIDRAGTCHRQALSLSRQGASPWDEAHALAGLGRCARAAHHHEEATERLHEALLIFRRIGASDAIEVAFELKAVPKAG